MIPDAQLAEWKRLAEAAPDDPVEDDYDQEENVCGAHMTADAEALYEAARIAVPALVTEVARLRAHVADASLAVARVRTVTRSLLDSTADLDTYVDELSQEIGEAERYIREGPKDR